MCKQACLCQSGRGPREGEARIHCGRSPSTCRIQGRRGWGPELPQGQGPLPSPRIVGQPHLPLAANPLGPYPALYGVRRTSPPWLLLRPPPLRAISSSPQAKPLAAIRGLHQGGLAVATPGPTYLGLHPSLTCQGPASPGKAPGNQAPASGRSGAGKPLPILPRPAPEPDLSAPSSLCSLEPPLWCGRQYTSTAMGEHVFILGI